MQNFAHFSWEIGEELRELLAFKLLCINDPVTQITNLDSTNVSILKMSK